MTLDDIKKKVEELVVKINAPTDLLPTYGYTKDFAYPHIEIDKVGFLHYVIVERGQELDRRTTEKYIWLRNKHIGFAKVAVQCC